MKYGKLKAFHCEKCGSGIELADGKCAYCHSGVNFRKAPNENVRVFVELDSDKRFYFHQVTSFGTDYEPERIEITTLEDNISRFIKQNNFSKLNLTCNFTQDALFKANFIKEQKKNKYNVYVEYVNMDGMFKVSADNIVWNLPRTEHNTLMQLDINMDIHDYDGFVKDVYTVPEGRTCPNCGAKLKRHFGLCDYCGGWVEFDDCFYR